MGIADLLAQTNWSAQQDEYVQIFRRASDNLLNLINDILDLSKVEASQLEPERSNFDLIEQIKFVIGHRFLTQHQFHVSLGPVRIGKGILERCADQFVTGRGRSRP